ncbi:hypothetical protein QR680_012551 [Steinernema hermaphroditum]|uniref:MADF domain-containing protein n=1 Tax=Steinernema hermaphroditum TaxID=289476 RepID=A0AA39I550_9BILA|nr:hypothetical protein QR680_012551 [Steinernema hermaphroditum]
MVTNYYTPVEDVRKQWRNLRDAFFKQKRRLRPAERSVGLPKWKIFLAPDLEEKYKEGDDKSTESSEPAPKKPQRDFHTQRLQHFGEYVVDTLKMAADADVDVEVFLQLEIDLRGAMVDAVLEVKLAKKSEASERMKEVTVGGVEEEGH